MSAASVEVWHKGRLRHSFGAFPANTYVAYKFLGVLSYGPVWALKITGAKGFRQVTQEYAGKNCMTLVCGKVQLSTASQKQGDLLLSRWLASHNRLKTCENP